MKRFKRYAVIFAEIFTVLVYSKQSIAQANCPTTVTSNRTTSFSDAGTPNCGITINNGVTFSTTGRAIFLYGNGSSVLNNGTITSVNSYAVQTLATGPNNINSVINTNTIRGGGVAPSTIPAI